MAGCLYDTIASHGVANENSVFKIKLFYYGRDIFTIGCNGPCFTSRAGLPMSCKIERYDLVVVGERYSLSIPIASAAGPAMYEYKGGFSRALYFVRDWNAIERSFGLRGSLLQLEIMNTVVITTPHFFHASLKGAIHRVDRSGL
jgi:hypothetical protein